MDKEIFKKGINFKCQGSSNCCVSHGNNGYVYLSNKDLNKLATFFKISATNFKNQYCDYSDGYLHLKEINANDDCQFLHKKKCSVYNARPTQCRTWPFWKENMKAKTWNNYIVNFCPGIGKGKKININQIEKQIKIDSVNERKIIKK